MQFQISHQIQYDFSRPVFLEPHVLRLRPRADGSQSIESFRLDVAPKPEGLWPALDPEGNAVSIAWFSGLHSSLLITAHCVVATGRENPFAFLIASNRTRLPMSYPPDEEFLLSPARVLAPVSEPDRVGEFARGLQRETGDQVVPFLWRLTQRIHDGWTVVRREHGSPWTAAETFEEKSGACRDLVVLFVEVCRQVGLAARFVSGYQCHLLEGTPHDLHAWAEVYLPGAGWVGYDPTLGLAVAGDHVALAASVFPERTAPASGSFRATSATATLSAFLSVVAVDNSTASALSASATHRA